MFCGNKWSYGYQCSYENKLPYRKKWSHEKIMQMERYMKNVRMNYVYRATKNFLLIKSDNKYKIYDIILEYITLQ